MNKIAKSSHIFIIHLITDTFETLEITIRALSEELKTKYPKKLQGIAIMHLFLLQKLFLKLYSLTRPKINIL